ncbi:hypothetical protein [Nocardia sp. NPDC051832]|uniref:hypothetical protein n=1 Tax=Nocardia sp. NPDC051832 TaxID=3155673 RepID=UPI003442620E
MGPLRGPTPTLTSRHNLVANNGFTATGEVNAIGAKIGGDVSLIGATFTNPDSDALSLDGATITGDLLANNGFTATGEVTATGAKIGGDVSLTGATFTNPDGDALCLDSTTITGNLFAESAFTATGKVRAVAAKIGGMVSLTGATFTNPDGDALNLSAATISGDLFADDGLTATGKVHATGAKIGGMVSLTGATFTNPADDALNLSAATISGDLFADDGFTATGRVNAIGAKIGGELSLIGSRLINLNGAALDLESSVLTTLRLQPAHVDGSIDLTRATITDLRAPSEALPPGRLIATGWQVTDIHGLIRSDRRAAAQWLKSTPAEHGFTAQPWHALATVYDRNGQPADARRLRFAAANQTTKHAPYATKLLRWVYMAVAGHGYYPLLAAVWLAGALLLGVLITAGNTEHFTPTDRVTANRAATTYADETHTPAPKSITAADSCTRYPDYPCFNAFNYALAGVVPAATGVTKADWTISSTAPTALTLSIPGLRILAWIFTAILLAGVTGLLRKG